MARDIPNLTRDPEMLDVLLDRWPELPAGSPDPDLDYETRRRIQRNALRSLRRIHGDLLWHSNADVSPDLKSSDKTVCYSEKGRKHFVRAIRNNGNLVGLLRLHLDLEQVHESDPDRYEIARRVVDTLHTILQEIRGLWQESDRMNEAEAELLAAAQEKSSKSPKELTDTQEHVSERIGKRKQKIRTCLVLIRASIKIAAATLPLNEAAAKSLAAPRRSHFVTN